MENLILYSLINEDKNYILVKNIYKYEEFKKVVKVFSNPPYNEILTDNDCKIEFNSYIENGFIIGCYVNDDIAGINCILNDVPKNYSIKFYDKSRIAYYSGLAVKEEYRKMGLGKLLVSKTQNYIEQDERYDFSLARILCKGSMSEGIFKKNNFFDAYDHGELIIDEVEYLRNTGNIEKDSRKYMIKKIRKSDNFYYRGNYE